MTIKQYQQLKDLLEMYRDDLKDRGYVLLAKEGEITLKQLISFVKVDIDGIETVGKVSKIP